ncbi:hypothetical protein D3C81_1444200 [compost metagenome]
MGDAEVDQARFFTAGNHFDRMPEDFFGAADELAAVARLAQGVGADDTYRAVRHAADQLGEALEAVQAALHRFFVELALFVDAGGQLNLLPETLENTDLGMVGLGHYHMETVGAQVNGSDQGQILGCGLRHGHGFSVDNPAILPRSRADANAQLIKA